ncbi:alpha/beta hydrolase family protein [Hymenobacter weizhouensis]|uniref:alpha/beta hydrolase family protein n=1 Tax=Hymenobacter sp. YIM 151500-1 TaxID=2987689 RepID=UPI0022271436|nr:lipase family protein [Hymenobacter sp. YIM 151500-1]UYZ61997.1 lipase family protein [Hymenobacter sp. YIM 151500-1]
MQRRLAAWLLCLTLTGASAAGCQSSDTSPNPTPAAPAPEAPAPVLVAGTLLGEYTPADLAGRVGNIPLLGSLARYPIRVYRLTYTTRNVDGKSITASGALLVPVAPQAVSVISYQHGTIRPDDERRAPSYYSAGSELWTAVSVLASTGYAVAAPDYIGYGACKALPHPYEHGASLASASVDMLRAAREFCTREKVALTPKNFLLGYSEGGYATMAMHKLLEEKYAQELPVTASAPGAGAYHKSAFAKHILSSDQPLNFLSTYVWVLHTYNRVYDLNRPLAMYFNEPWAARLQADPFSDVPRLPKQLFAESFRQGVLSGSDAGITAAFRANDLHDWKPRAPLALFHGTADDYVPFFNSQDAYNAMRARGATQVELHPIQGGNHFSSVGQYTLEAFAFISKF